LIQYSFFFLLNFYSNKLAVSEPAYRYDNPVIFLFVSRTRGYRRSVNMENEVCCFWVTHDVAIPLQIKIFPFPAGMNDIHI